MDFGASADALSKVEDAKPSLGCKLARQRQHGQVKSISKRRRAENISARKKKKEEKVKVCKLKRAMLSTIHQVPVPQLCTQRLRTPSRRPPEG